MSLGFAAGCGSRTEMLDPEPRADAGSDAALCASEDPVRVGQPIFEARGLDAILGTPCDLRDDTCRGRDVLLVCVDDARDPTGDGATCRRCVSDDECDLEYRSYGLRADPRCQDDGTCTLRPPPSGMGECDTTEECQTSTGTYACVDHRCVICGTADDCSTSRMGLCECAGSCAFPIPPGG